MKPELVEGELPLEMSFLAFEGAGAGTGGSGSGGTDTGSSGSSGNSDL